MSLQTENHHDITICQDNIAGIGTHVYLGGTEIHGIQSIAYDLSMDSVAEVTLGIVPSRCNVNVLADLGAECRHRQSNYSDQVHPV